jgi:hypothetical protein
LLSSPVHRRTHRIIMVSLFALPAVYFVLAIVVVLCTMMTREAVIVSSEGAYSSVAAKIRVVQPVI